MAAHSESEDAGMEMGSWGGEGDGPWLPQERLSLGGASRQERRPGHGLGCEEAGATVPMLRARTKKRLRAAKERGRRPSTTSGIAVLPILLQ